MKKLSLLFFAVLFGIGLVMGGIPSVYAQGSDSEEFQLEEVTVTAQKRAENQQKVPIQMEVISGEDLVGTGKDNIDDILRDVSNVMITKNSDGMRIAARGLTDDESVNFDMHISTPTVAVNIDGAYSGSSSAGQNLFDVERVEVLAGPQSTLYGSNSPGGIVNVVTASPKTDKFSGNASIEYGSYNLIDGQIAVNVPVIRDLLAMRLAGQVYQRDSWLDGAQDNDQDTKTVRLKTLIEPSETFSTDVTVNYSTSISGGRLGGTALMFDYNDGHYYEYNGATASFGGDPIAEVTNPWTSADVSVGGPGPPTTNAADAMTSDAETIGLRADIDWDTAVGAISFVPYYNDRSSSQLRNDVEINQISGSITTTQKNENSLEEKGAELRIVSPEDFPFKWIVGGTYFEADSSNKTTDQLDSVRDHSDVMFQKNHAVYANITYPVTDEFRGTVGYRRSWDEATFDNLPANIHRGQEYNKPDYKVGVEYDVSESAMLWANYATSYRVNVMATNNEYQSGRPEELKAYSLGLKSRFLDNKLQMNTTAYYYDYQNKMMHPGQGGIVNTRGNLVNEAEWGYDFNYDGDTLDTNADTPDLLAALSAEYGLDLTNELTLENRLVDPWETQYGAFETYGVDVSVDYVPTAKDRVTLSVSYLHAEWADATNHYAWSDYFLTTGWEGKSYNGQRATYSPEWSVNASYEHGFDLGSFGTLRPEIDLQYKTDYDIYMELNYPFGYQEAYTIYNASVRFDHSSGRWSLNAYVKNIGDYAAKTFWQQAGPGSTPELGLTDPRTCGAVFSLKY